MVVRETQMSRYDDNNILILLTYETSFKRQIILNEKGLFYFKEEKSIQPCIDGKKSFLMSSLAYIGLEAYNEINYLIKKGYFKSEEELAVLNDYKNHFITTSSFEV